MAYDPQANRRRPQVGATDPAPVDAILGESTRVPAHDDPPPTPAVTPAPADPVPDKLLVNTGVAAAVGALVALLTLRHFWKRHTRQPVDADE